MSVLSKKAERLLEVLIDEALELAPDLKKRRMDDGGNPEYRQRADEALRHLGAIGRIYAAYVHDKHVDAASERAERQLPVMADRRREIGMGRSSDEG